MALKIVVLLKLLQMVYSHSSFNFEAACRSKGGVFMGDQCFIFSAEDDVRTWQGAMQHCSQTYGPLAQPAYPNSIFPAAKIAGVNESTPFWVGGFSPPYEKSFRWINGTQIPEDRADFPWASDEPSPPKEPFDQRCMLGDRERGGYTTQNCSNDNEQRYVCSLDACGVMGGVTLGYQCLKIMTNPTTWQNATGACTHEGGRLIVPNYPQLLINYLYENETGPFKLGSDGFWVGGLQTNISDRDSWYWLNGQQIPLGEKNFPWLLDQPEPEKHCLDTGIMVTALGLTGYGSESCNTTQRFICELDTSMTPQPSSVQFVIPQVSSGKYIGPETVFPNIQDNNTVILHFTLDPNMHMTFDIVDGIWGYIRHIISGKILTPMDNSIGNDIKPMNPEDGTKVVLQSHRRPWALFALDQYNNRIIHRSGKFISSDGKYITITGDESDNKTMEFLFNDPNHPNKEVLPYGYPVISGDWKLVFSVLNPLSTSTYSAKVTIGRSESLSSSHDFKFGFEVAKDKRTSSTSAYSSYDFGFGSDSSYDYNSKSIHGSYCLGWPWSRACIGASSKSGSGSSSSNTHGGGSSSSTTSTSSSDTTTTDSLSVEMQQTSSDTWNSARTHDISFTVEAGKSVAIWQRIFIIEHMGHKAVHLSNMYADTDSSRVKPNNISPIPHLTTITLVG